MASRLPDPGPPADLPGLPDQHGRVATDLRVSLTDRCNLRCAYCMPTEGLPWLPTPDVLTDDEVVRLLRVAVERLGVDLIRFTGEEPMLRASLAGKVYATAVLKPHTLLSLTPICIVMDSFAGSV